MKTSIKVTFADGGMAVVAFGRQSPARIELVLLAWGLLWQRDVRGWKRASEPAEYWYDGRRKQLHRYDEPHCPDLLADVIPIAVAFQRRQREILALRKRGRGVRDIARELRMPLSSVENMIEKSGWKS